MGLGTSKAVPRGSRKKGDFLVQRFREGPVCPRERPSPCTRWGREVIALSLPGEGPQWAKQTAELTL